MLSLSVSAHAEAASTPASQEEARLATVFQGVADVWGSNISVAEIKTLQDFAGNEYTLAANSHFLRTAGPHFPDNPGHIKRTALETSRTERRLCPANQY